MRARGATQDAAVDALGVAIERAKREATTTHAGSLDEMLDRWLAWLRPTLRASSFADYEAAMRLYVRPDLGALRIARVTTTAVGEVIERIMARGHITTADKVRRLLGQAFRWGMRRGYAAANPVDGLDPVRRRRPDVEAWTAAQLAAFLQAARGSRYFALFYAAASTSMRKGELLALRWSDVEGDTIHVRRTMSKGAPGGIADGAKTKDGHRRVPVSADLARVLAEQRRATRGSALVFPSRSGGPLSGSNVNRRMRDIAQAAGVPVVRFHDIRKTSASLLARAGVSPAVIQARLGHASPALALRVYTRVFEEDSRRAVLDLGGLRGGLPTARRRTLPNAGRGRVKGGKRAGRGRSRLRRS